MGIDEFLATGNLGQIDGSVDGCVDTADMRNHDGRVQMLFAKQSYDVAHVSRGTAADACYMMLCVVHIIEIEVGAKVFIQRTSEEIQA